MPQNQNLLNALNDPNLASTANYQMALDALLAADPANPAAFKEAVSQNQAVWEALGVDFADSAADDFLFPDGENADYNFQALRKVAAEKRVVHGLKNASQPLLIQIIQSATHAAVRETIAAQSAANSPFGNFTRVPEWDVDNENIITNQAADTIRKEAKGQLLLQGIEKCNDKNKIDALLLSRDDLTFIAAVKTLFGIEPSRAQPTLETMERTLLADDVAGIKKTAAKRGFSLYVKGLTDNEIKDLGVGSFQKDNEAFKNGFPNEQSARSLADADIPDAKALLAGRYLKVTLKNASDGDVLRSIAASADIDQAKGFIHNLSKIEVPYLDLVVTEAALKDIKQTAASQALKLKINQVDDFHTLDLLTEATTHADIQHLLVEKDNLGYQNNQPFREAFTEDSAAKEMAAVASVRKHLLSSTNTVHLQELILVDVTADDGLSSFLLKYNQLIAPRVASPEERKLLSDPANVTHAKEQALIRLAKIALTHLRETDVARIANQSDQQQLDNSLSNLLGQPGTIPDVIEVNAGESLAKILQAHAAREVTLRATKRIDLSGSNLTEFVDKINDLNSIGDPTDISGAEGLTQNYEGLNVGEAIAVLSEKEKQTFRVDLVKCLVSNYPSSTPVLTGLAKAENINSFKSKLTEMGITEHTWVNDDTMKSIQGAACARALSLNFGAISAFGTRPALQTLLEGLPAEKQQILLAKPRIVRSLMDAPNVEDLQRVLGHDIHLNETLLTNLAEENKQFALVSRLINADVAKIIGNQIIAREITLTSAQVEDINNVLMSPNFDAATYKQAIDAIANTLGLTNDALDQAFGIPLAEGNEIYVNVNTQQTHNENLLNEYNKGAQPDGAAPQAPVPPATQAEKAIFKFLMGLHKQAAFPPAEIQNILRDFYQSQTAADFIKKIKDNNALQAVFTPGELERQITPELFKATKIEVVKKVYLNTNLSPAQIKEFSSFQMTERKSYVPLHRQIIDTDQAILDELNFLSQTSSIDWFNPAFQAEAKLNAREMHEHYLELDKVSKTLIAFYENEIALFTAQMASVPTPGEIEQAYEGQGKSQAVINERKEELLKYKLRLDEFKTNAQEELDRYQKIQHLLHGDPQANNLLLRKGVIRTLEEAKAGKNIKFLAYESACSDHPISKKKELLRNTAENDEIKRKPTEINGQLKERGFKVKDAIPTGYLRQHTVAYRNIDPSHLGSFLDECPIAKSELNKHQRIEYASDFRVTLRKVPAKTTPDSESARNCTYMAMAMQALSHHGRPTPDRPLYLTSYSKEEGEGVWMALMAIGQSDPNLKFNSDCVELGGTAFKSKEDYVKKDRIGKGETITHPGFKEFLKDPAVKSCIDNIKEYDERKFGKKAVKQKEESNTAVRAATGLYKNQLKEVISQVEKKNQEIAEQQPVLGGRVP
jgi:hypothetical protein